MRRRTGFGRRAGAQQHGPPDNPAAVAAKSGPARRSQRHRLCAVARARTICVQADLSMLVRSDRTLFYRFKLVDNAGNQVGDGESWKQGPYRAGLGQQTIKSVAPTGAAVDLRLEPNVEPR